MLRYGILFLLVVAIISVIAKVNYAYPPVVQEVLEEPLGRGMLLLMVLGLTWLDRVVGVFAGIFVTLMMLEVRTSGEVLGFVSTGATEGFKDAEEPVEEKEGMSGEEADDADEDEVDIDGLIEDMAAEKPPGEDAFVDTAALVRENSEFAATLAEFMTAHRPAVERGAENNGKLEHLMTNQFGLMESLKSQLGRASALRG